MKHLPPAVLALLIATPALACELFRIGDIEVDQAWSRATIGTDRPGVVYLSIHNAGSTDDVLTRVATPIAGTAMLHQTVVTDAIASMPHVMSVPVPARQSVALQPGGFHAMLMGLTGALAKGDSFPLTLTFAQAGEVTIPVNVLGMGAKGADCKNAQP